MRDRTIEDVSKAIVDIVALRDWAAGVDEELARIKAESKDWERKFKQAEAECERLGYEIENMHEYSD